MEKELDAQHPYSDIIEAQIKKWQAGQRMKYKNPIRPVITISGLPGANAGSLAQKLADKLDIDLFSREIIHKISTNAHISQRVLETLDDQDRSIRDEWISALGDERKSYEYVQHLTEVICSIGAHGYAIIVGRGAGFILPQQVSLRLLIVAPFDVRIANVMKKYSVSENVAREKVLETELERMTFIKTYFQAEMIDPSKYDLVINTHHIDIDLAARIVKETFNSRNWYDYSGK
jgi:cytidylate kinase